MEKSILVTNVDGLLFTHETFIEPHRSWFKRAIEKTGDDSLNKWIGKKDYFLGVNEAMKKLMPNATEKERTTQAREWYQKAVVNYIKSHPETVKREIAQKLISLKDKYKIILVTTNTQDYIGAILKTAQLEGVYEDIIASKIEEEPNKEDLIKELIKRHGKPKYYLTGKIEDSINQIFKRLETKVLGINQVKEL